MTEVLNALPSQKLKHDILARVGKRERNGPQDFGRLGTRLLQIEPCSTRQVHEHDAFDGTTIQEMEQIIGLAVGNFAYQQIQRLFHQRGQILRRTNVGAVPHPGPIRLQQKTKSLERLGILRLKRLPKTVEVRGGKRRHFHVMRHYRLTGFQRLEPQPKRQ